MDKSRDDYQVEDFISDESFINYHLKSSINDRLSWEDWLEKNPTKLDLVNEAREMINDLSFNLSEKEYHQELKRITSAVNNDNQGTGVQIPTGNDLKFHRRKKRTLLYILPFILIVILGGYFFFQSSWSHTEDLVQTLNESNFPMVITLSDSTVVSLEPNSYLRYPLLFEGNERNVYLHGNAQFNVKRNTVHPFKVHIENMVATVLGTVFNISSGDSGMTVKLLKGKLNVEIIDSKMNVQESVLLNPDESAVYQKSAHHLYKNLLNSGNQLSFRQSNFEDVAGKIKNTFGVSVINESKNNNWRFTGEFKNSTARDIIENICLIKNLSFVVKGDTIVIK